MNIRNGKLVVMVIDVDNLYNIRLAEDKNRAILAVDPEAENLELLRLKKLHIETRMKDVFFEKSLLFRELSNELMFL